MRSESYSLRPTLVLTNLGIVEVVDEVSRTNRVVIVNPLKVRSAEDMMSQKVGANRGAYSIAAVKFEECYGIGC